MCAYNSGPYIEKAIQSVLDQTYHNWELIISEDKSTDNTVDLIRNFLSDSRIKLIEQPVNLGYLKNKNTVFSYATGDLLTQLDADDISEPTRIEKQVDVFIKNPDIKICGTNYTIIDNQDNILSTSDHPADFIIPGLQLEYPFWFPNLMFRKDIVNEFGLFDEYFSGIAGDDHYWVFIVSSKYPIYFINEALYHYRVYPQSFTNTFSVPRKLITEEILKELYRQRVETGTDWLEQGEKEKMLQFENQLFDNSVLMSEKYRISAAKAIDAKNWGLAIDLIKKSIRLNKANLKSHQTLFYYLRKRFYAPIAFVLFMAFSVPVTFYKKLSMKPAIMELYCLGVEYNLTVENTITQI